MENVLGVANTRRRPADEGGVSSLLSQDVSDEPVRVDWLTLQRAILRMQRLRLGSATFGY